MRKLNCQKKVKDKKGQESWRDSTITIKCATCGKKYHPRNNGYQATSRYCSQECCKRGRKSCVTSKGKVSFYPDFNSLSDNQVLERLI